MAGTNLGVNIQINAHATAANRALAQTSASLNSVSTSMRNMVGAVSAGTIIADVFTRIGAAIGDIPSKLIDVQRQFDVINSSLVTVTGGAREAESAFAWIKEFAATTPYQLDEVTQAFIKMKALGLDASKSALASYGNTASAMGKSLNQMVEAVADAATGEFERLKEFGIKAKQQGDKVTLTFQGVSTTIRNSSAEITRYLNDIGNNQFAGAMSVRAKTLDGQISNLADSWDELFRAINKSGAADASASAVNRLTKAIKGATDALDEATRRDWNWFSKAWVALGAAGAAALGAETPEQSAKRQIESRKGNLEKLKKLLSAEQSAKLALPDLKAEFDSQKKPAQASASKPDKKAAAEKAAAAKAAAQLAAETMKYEFDAAMEVEDYRVEQETKARLAQREAGRQLAGTGFAGDSEFMDMLARQAEEISRFQSEIASGADVTAEFDSTSQRLASIRSRLDAEVNIGLKSQTAAQIELREETGRLGDELARSLLPRLNELIAAAPDDATREKWRALYAEINGMQSTGSQVGPFAGLKRGLDDYANSATDTFSVVKDAVGNAFKGMEDALTTFVMTGKLSFKDLANSIIADMVRMMIQKSITAPLAAAASSMFGFADGGAPGGVSAWRNQIVSQPTFFKFASGGVMGEAGPEAIMPLKRGAGGRLGVDASGMGGGSVTVIVNNNGSNTQATQTTRTDSSNNRIIEVLIEQIDGAMASGITRGSSKTAAAMGNTFGLNRVAGSY